MDALYTHETSIKYPNFLAHIEKLYLSRKDKWAHCTRIQEKLPTYSTNTNNYVESMFKQTKDIQFGRSKAYNLPDLLDTLLDDSEFLRQKLIDVGNGRSGQDAQSRFKIRETKITKDEILEISHNVFLVESQSTKYKFYTVDYNNGDCECPAGINKGPCAHKNAIAYHLKISSFNYLPTSDN